MTTPEALKIFGLENLENATSKTLKNNYHKLAKTKHPDKNGGSSLDFVELKEAYNLLLKDLKNIENNSSNNDLESVDDLSREEILDKYKQTSTSLVAYQNAVANQIFSLDLTSQNVTTTIDKYKQKKLDLKSNFEVELTKLEKEVYPNFLRRTLFFIWPTISEDEFWVKFLDLKNKYTTQERQLSNDFYEDLIINLTGGINQISSTIQKIDAN